jgi:hypothetical protein
MYYRRRTMPALRKTLSNSTLKVALQLAVAILFCLAFTTLSLYLAYRIPKSEGQTTAAWFQGVGSVGAILLAVLIAAYQARASRVETERAQNLVDSAKKKGVLAVASAASEHAARIGKAMSTDEPRSLLYEVYDQSIIEGMVGALSAAPVYELGDPKAVSAVIKMRDQFVFLGRAMETFIAGPWNHPFIGPKLKQGAADPTPEYQHIYRDLAESAEKTLARNARDRTESIQSAYNELQLALK